MNLTEWEEIIAAEIIVPDDIQETFKGELDLKEGYLRCRWS